MAGEREQTVLTMSEVAEQNGQEGRRAYIVFEGTVYDVTDSPLWRDGVHMRSHLAGTDLTDQLATAPHWAEVMSGDRVIRVGELEEGSRKRCLPWGMDEVCRAFPSIRRHPHPVAAHFPVAYFCTAALFVVLHLITTTLLGQDLERMAYVLLFLGTVFGLIAMATGFLTLWANYRFKTPRLVKLKIALSVTMLVCAGIGLLMGAGGPPQTLSGSILYHGLLVVLALITLAIGYLGGQMTFPTRTR